MQSTKRRCRLAALLITAMAVGAVGTAAAAETEPDERGAYVERLEPICKENVLANKRIFKGAKEEVRKGELKKASGHFSRAATAFAKTIGQMAAVPKPVADEARLDRWFKLLRVEKGLIGKIGTALRKEDEQKAEVYSVELNRNSGKANNTVLFFGFDYCRIEPARFG